MYWEIILFGFFFQICVFFLFFLLHNQFLKEEEVLDKVEIWTQKYPHAHPMWFGSFSAFLVITDPDYAKVLLGRGGERLWLQLWSSNPSLQISLASLKTDSKAGFQREVSLQKSSQGMERSPPSCCALGASGTGLQG